MGDAKRSSSTAEAAKLACAEGLNSKNNSTLSSSVLNLVLLRHVVLKPKLVMPRESGRLGVHLRYAFSLQAFLGYFVCLINPRVCFTSLFLRLEDTPKSTVILHSSLDSATATIGS